MPAKTSGTPGSAGSIVPTNANDDQNGGQDVPEVVDVHTSHAAMTRREARRRAVYSTRAHAPRAGVESDRQRDALSAIEPEFDRHGAPRGCRPTVPHHRPEARVAHTFLCGGIEQRMS